MLLLTISLGLGLAEESPYFTTTSGTLGTLDYAVHIHRRYDNKTTELVSAWDDIPLFASKSRKTYNFVCEIPQKSTMKYEMQNDKGDEKHPIQQDTEEDPNAPGQRRGRHVNYKGGSLANYGYFAQTWEDPNVREDFFFGKPEYSTLPGDGDPIDVLVLGEYEPCKTGQVYPVELLGGLALVDSNERDWKILTVRAREHGQGQLLKSMQDFEMEVEELKEWFSNYKFEAKGITNVIAKQINAGVAELVVEETHRQWLDDRQKAKEKQEL